MVEKTPIENITIVRYNNGKMKKECKFWKEGHKYMNCKYCKTPNQKYCKKWKND